MSPYSVPIHAKLYQKHPSASNKISLPKWNLNWEDTESNNRISHAFLSPCCHSSFVATYMQMVDHWLEWLADIIFFFTARMFSRLSWNWIRERAFCLSLSHIPGCCRAAQPITSHFTFSTSEDHFASLRKLSHGGFFSPPHPVQIKISLHCLLTLQPLSKSNPEDTSKLCFPLKMRMCDLRTWLL